MSSYSTTTNVICQVRVLQMHFLQYPDGFGKIPAQSKENLLFLAFSEVQEDEHKPRAYPKIKNVNFLSTEPLSVLT